MNLRKYNLANLQKVASFRGLAGVVSHFGMSANRKLHDTFHSDGGIEVVAEEWDTLIILDGCRYDTFADCVELEGRLERRRSAGSESGEFIEHNFIGKALHDTVYITANPFANSIPDGTFHYIENVLESQWDDALRTVPPGAVADRVVAAHSRFPNKRIIAHFMQPHYPFIGDYGRQLESGGISPESGATDDQTAIWAQLQYGLGVTEDEVRQAYRENLTLVLDNVEELLNSISGRTVITADHGNLIGDRLSPIPVRGYGHPPSLYADPLVNVPWFVIDGNRREISSDPPVASERVSDDEVGARLEALGYR